MLDLQRMAKGRVFVAPCLDHELMPADALGQQSAAPAVIAERRERRTLPVLLVGRLPQQLGRQHVVAVGEDVGFDRDRPTDDALGGKRAAAHLRRHAIDDDRRRAAWRRSPHARSCRLPSRTAAMRLTRTTRTSPAASRSGGGPPSIVRGLPSRAPAAGSRGSRLTGIGCGLRRIIVDQDDDALLRRPASGGIEPRQDRHVGRRIASAGASARRRRTMTGVRPRAVACLTSASRSVSNPAGIIRPPPVAAASRSARSRWPTSMRSDPHGRFDQPDDRRDASERFVFLGIPGGPTVPPGGRREDAIEPDAGQIGMARPAQPRGPRPETAVRLAAGRGDDLLQGFARERLQADKPKSRGACPHQGRETLRPPRHEPVDGVVRRGAAALKAGSSTGIDDVARVVALIEAAGFARTGTVGRQPVEHDIEEQPQTLRAKCDAISRTAFSGDPAMPNLGSVAARSEIRNGSPPAGAKIGPGQRWSKPSRAAVAACTRQSGAKAACRGWR